MNIRTVTVIAQWAKTPDIHGYVAGSIPAVTPRYCSTDYTDCPEYVDVYNKKTTILDVLTFAQTILNTHMSAQAVYK
jgi:hypothetical protein